MATENQTDTVNDAFKLIPNSFVVRLPSFFFFNLN